MSRIFKEMIILTMGFVALIYLFLPSPLFDVIPFVGWLDEGAATLILLNTMKYYGIDLTDLYGKPKTRRVVRRKRRRPEITDDDQAELIEIIE